MSLTVKVISAQLTRDTEMFSKMVLLKRYRTLTAR